MSTEGTTQEPKRLWLAFFFGTVFTLAGTASWFLWVYSRLMQSSVALAFDRPMPALTTFFFDYRIGILLFPAPWLVFAIYALVRGRTATHHLVLFSSSLILALGTLSIIIAIGFSLPWLPAKIVTMGHSQPSATPIPK